jgi:hypothetical protein
MTIVVIVSIVQSGRLVIIAVSCRTPAPATLSLLVGGRVRGRGNRRDHCDVAATGGELKGVCKETAQHLQGRRLVSVYKGTEATSHDIMTT